MKKIDRIILSGLLYSSVLGLAACVSDHERMIQEGYPAAYATGFEDGCHSGKKAGGSMFDQFRKDVRRFASDTQYAQGWSDGFRECESEEEALLRQQRVVVEQQKLLEQQRHDRREEREYHHLRHHRTKHRHKNKEQRMLNDALEGVDTKALEKSLREKYP